jgi:ferredoxin
MCHFESIMEIINKEEEFMTEKNLKLTRRKFMLVSSAAVAAPFVMKMAGSAGVAEAGAAEKEKQYVYTIGKGCLGCHYCFNECPGKAIQWGDDTYVIDQKKCLHCGTCYKVCNAGIVTRK